MHRLWLWFRIFLARLWFRLWHPKSMVRPGDYVVIHHEDGTETTFQITKVNDTTLRVEGTLPPLPPDPVVLTLPYRLNGDR